MNVATIPERTSLFVREPDRLHDLLGFLVRMPGGPGRLVVSSRAQGRRCQAAAEIHRQDCPAASDGEPFHSPLTDLNSSVFGFAHTAPQPVLTERAVANAPTVCSCVLGEIPEPQRFLDDLHELLEFREALEGTRSFNTTLLPGVVELLASRMRFRAVKRPLHSGLNPYIDHVLGNAPTTVPSDSTGFSRYAARKVTYDRLIDSGVLRPSTERLAKVLETWLLNPNAIDDPYGTLDDAFRGVPARPDDPPLYTATLSALRFDWCGTLKLAHAGSDLIVCEIVGPPGSDLGIRGAVAAAGARVGDPFSSVTRSFGAYPEVVARWLGMSSVSYFAAEKPGPAVLRPCGPLACDPAQEDWESAFALYDDAGGFGSFADALSAATLL